MENEEKYGLTLEQMQALGGVIKDNVGKVKELTADDHDWPTDNPTAIALWRLPSGIYYAEGNVNLNFSTGSSTDGGQGQLLIIGKGPTSTKIYIESLSSGNVSYLTCFKTASDGRSLGSTRILTEGLVKNNLTSTDTNYPLSAMQGKVLKDMIDNLPTGGVTELTAADYNWNSTAGDATTEPFDCVALWLLSPGQYTWKDGVAFKLLSTWTTAGTYSGNATIWDAGNSFTGIAADYRGIGRQIRYANASGVQSWGNNGLLSTDVYQSGDFNKVRIGYNTTSSGARSIAIGRSASSAGSDSIAIGNSSVSSAVGTSSVAIGKEASVSSLNGIAIGESAKTTGNYGGHVSIGQSSECQGNGSSVAVGASSSTKGAYSVALGGQSGTYANAAYSVALGHDSKTTMQGEVGIGLNSSSTYGYNNSPYRLLTGLYDGQTAHDAATYGQVVSYAALNGAGAPTTATEGRYVGQLYYDTTNEAMYFLKTIDTTTTPATYTWEALGSGGGGGGPTVVQTTGSSTTDVMSQNAATSMVYADPATGQKVNIGATTNTGNYTTAVGYQSYVSNANRGVAIGYRAEVTANGAVAIGTGASAVNVGEVNIGSSTSTAYGYNNSNYRLLTGLYDPQSDHDAATKGYVDPSTDSSAPTTSTVGRLGEIRIDTSTNTAYMCVSADDVTPAYEWRQITA